MTHDDMKPDFMKPHFMLQSVPEKDPNGQIIISPAQQSPTNGGNPGDGATQVNGPPSPSPSPMLTLPATLDYFGACRRRRRRMLQDSNYYVSLHVLV